MAKRATPRKPKTPAGHGHPRPLLQRESWTSLNGPWDFVLDPNARWRSPREVQWNGTILVPFAPGDARRAASATPASIAAAGTAAPSTSPELNDGERLLLHFGAVDYAATVWVNGALAGRHEGGYTPFTRRHHRAARRADGRRRSSCAPRTTRTTSPSRAASRTGSSSRTRSGIRARPASGRRSGWSACPRPAIEQAPLDAEPRALGDRLRGVRSTGDAARRPALRGQAARTASALLARRHATRWSPARSHRRIALSDPGIDDYRNELLWSPRVADAASRPSCELLGRARRAARRGQQLHGAALDRRAGRPLRAERPPVPRCAWCSTRATGPRRGLTAPDDEALRRDVELAKAMGFNGVRKHQKIEDPRYLYWADRLGLLVWEEMPSAYRFTQALDRAADPRVDGGDRPRLQPPVHHRLGAVQRVVGRARTCRTTPAQRHYVAGALPPDQDARPDAAGDRQRRLGERRDRHHRHPRLRRASRSGSQSATRREDVAAAAVQARAPRRPAPGARGARAAATSPIMLTEFGGIAYPRTNAAPGATRAHRRAEELAARYTRAARRGALARRSSPASATRSSPTPTRRPTACCADRTPKFPLEEIPPRRAGWSRRAG